MPELNIFEKRDSVRFAALATALLDQGLKVRFRARGASMQPNLRDGDSVIVAPVALCQIQAGEIVLSQNSDGLRVHRVVSVNKPDATVVTRGDAGCENDLPSREVLGKVVEIQRGNRAFSLAARGSRMRHTLSTFVRRLRLAGNRRLRSLRTSAFLAGIIVTLGLALFGAQPAAAQADLAITQTASVSTIPTNTNYTYTETVTNNGPNSVPANTLVVYQQTPANTNFRSITANNWTCSNPGSGNAGPVICTYNLALASGASTAANPITITMRVNTGTASGTTIQNSATVTSQTVDPTPTNNTSVTTILVEPAGDADLSVSMSALPTPVFVNSSLTYTAVVTDLGPASATGVTLTDTIPTGTTLVSATWPTGTCTGTTTISCALGTVAANASVTVTIVVTTPSTATSLSNTAQVATTGTDPVNSNNSATVITVVQPLICATPGRDGAGGTLTGIVNAYYPPSGSVVLNAGSTTVTLGAAAAGGAQTAIAAGDLLLFIQMQNADINSTNTSSYGDGLPGDPAQGSTSLNSSGDYEFVTATNAIPVTGGTLTFQGTGPTGGLLNTYTSAPAIGSTSLGTATAASWASGIASFTFPTPLPAGIVPSSALTTAGFAPAGYNLTAVTILSVNTNTGTITVALTTNPGAEKTLGTGSFVTQGQRTYQVIRVPQYT